MGKISESVLTHFITKTIFIYNWSYGLLPTILLEVKLVEKCVQFRWVGVKSFKSKIICGIALSHNLYTIITYGYVLCKAFFFSGQMQLKILDIVGFLMLFLFAGFPINIAINMAQNLDSLARMNKLFANKLKYRK